MIGIVMVKYRARIQRDQKLWLAGLGEAADDNPDYSVRRRFAKLYQVRCRTRGRAICTERDVRAAALPQDYKPELFAWRLVLLLRKLCLVCITELTGKNAMFQASLSLAVLAVSYGLQAKYHPFVTAVAQASALAEHSTSRAGNADAQSVQAERLSRRLGRRMSQVILDLAVSGARKTLASAEVLLDFNVLETTLLCTSTAVLLGGMMFGSSLLAPGSAVYTLLTVCVGGVTIGSVALFAVMVAVETRRTCRRRPAAQQRGTAPRSSGGCSAADGLPPVGGTGHSLTHTNPIHTLSLGKIASRLRQQHSAAGGADSWPRSSSADAAAPMRARPGGYTRWQQWGRSPSPGGGAAAETDTATTMTPIHRALRVQTLAAAPAAPITDGQTGVNLILASGGLRARVESMDAPRSSTAPGRAAGDGAALARGTGVVGLVGAPDILQQAAESPTGAAQ
jgi:hypothetical protein